MAFLVAHFSVRQTYIFGELGPSSTPSPCAFFEQRSHTVPDASSHCKRAKPQNLQNHPPRARHPTNAPTTLGGKHSSWGVGVDIKTPARRTLHTAVDKDRSRLSMASATRWMASSNACFLMGLVRCSLHPAAKLSPAFSIPAWALSAMMIND